MKTTATATATATAAGNAPGNATRGTRGPASPATADRIRALRLWLHRRLDQLYDQLTDPTYTGSIAVELSGKNGIPGEPRVTESRYGCSGL
jgi:hypothetical protein